MYPGLGHPPFQLYPILCHRIFSYRAEQRVRHHPYAGVRTDSHLFPAGFRLPCHAYIICRRFGGGHFPHSSVFPVQKLPAGQARELFVPCIRIHGNGKPALPATDVLRTRILDRRV